MPTLVITDIPRISALFEKMSAKRSGLVLVSEIHRGIEELDRLKPNLIIIQNHLSGLSADIVHKHLKSRLGKRKVRFALISASESMDVELSARFDAIIDPALSDDRLEQAIQAVFTPHERIPRRPAAQVSSILELPPVVEQEPELPGLDSEADRTETSGTDHPADTPAISPTTTKPAEQAVAREQTPETETALPAQITYDLPRRPNMSIISAFSQHLDSNSEELPEPRRQVDPREQELAIRDLHLQPHLISDYDEGPAPFYRRTSFWVLCCTAALVVAITMFQHRSSTPKDKKVELKATQKQVKTAEQPPNLPAVPVAPAAPVAPAVQPAAPAASAPSAATDALQSHGIGRPKSLPSFIPQAGIDRSYGKDNPGWENYRGQANEYRVFREKDSTIKAIQVIDRSGAGIQDAYYVGILKELAGVTAMRPTSSEIKEGYEIRRGETNGLQLVQYRDAQGGRLRGIVITWP